MWRHKSWIKNSLTVLNKHLWSGGKVAGLFALGVISVISSTLCILEQMCSYPKRRSPTAECRRTTRHSGWWTPCQRWTLVTSISEGGGPAQSIRAQGQGYKRPLMRKHIVEMSLGVVVDEKCCSLLNISKTGTILGCIIPQSFMKAILVLGFTEAVMAFSWFYLLNMDRFYVITS